MTSSRPLNTNTLENIRWNALQIRVLLLIVAIFFIDGVDMQIMALIVPSLVTEWGLQASQFAPVMAIGYVGSAIGALVGGALGDRLGRKTTIIGAVILLGVLTFAMAFSQSVNELIVLRFLAGLGLGGCIPPSTALLTETVPRQHRGIAIGMALVAMPLGISASGLLVGITVPHYGWQFPLIITGCTPIALALLLLVFLPRSAVSQEGKPLMKLPTPQLLDTLWSPQLRWSSVGLCGAFFCTYYTVTVVLSWLPVLLTGENFPHNIASTAPSVWGISGIISTFVTGWLVARFGARRVAASYVLSGSSALVFLALVSPAPDSGNLGLALLFVPLCIGGCSLSGLITALYTIAPDTYPASVRSTGIGITLTIGRVGGIVGALTGVYVITFGSFIGFFLISALFLIIAWLSLRLGQRPSLSPQLNE